MPNEDTTAIENREWIASLQWVMEHGSKERAGELLQLLREEAEAQGVPLNGKTTLHTTYQNTIPPAEESEYPGDLAIEQRIYNYIRWNAMAIVARANQKIEGIGGHISTYASSSTLWEVGLYHFWRGYGGQQPDLVLFQGHAAPGLYARSYLEYRMEESQLDLFRRESGEKDGLSSYPHPRLMPQYWRFPTVSMGLSAVQAIYHARFLKYLRKRERIEETDTPQRVWALLGDGEMDEPESTGALSIAANERLSELNFVISCNLQRLDGPVRGNRKVVNELEGLFKGAGWNVIKVIWGSSWDRLLEEDTSGALRQKLDEMPDGELQRLAQMDANELREELFTGELSALVEGWSDEELRQLRPGGHDPVKIYQAYKRATQQDGPTVILAQTIKGYRQGEAGEASNVSHQTKKMKPEPLKAFRDELELDIPNDQVEDLPYLRFEQDSPEYEYLKARRDDLGGFLPERRVLAEAMKLPDESIFKEFYEGSDGDEVATTMVFVKILSKLLDDENVGESIVPIIPDESRTFGMDALFRKVGIYKPQGQQYEPVDKDSLMYYREEKDGVLLEEGITEAGGMGSFMAAGSVHTAQPFFAIPFFAFYSMFGFQRIGDLIWAACDARVRGFLIGGVSGRTSLSGEGLQHTDGNSHLYALAYPNVQAYDPAFAFELAHILRDGIRRMYQDGEDLIYYLTVTNQVYPMPPQPEGTTQDLLKGLYRFHKSEREDAPKVNLMGSGAIMAEVQEAAAILEEEYGIAADIWSVTSYKALYDDCRDTERENLRYQTRRNSHLEAQLDGQGGCFVAATDYVKALPLSIAQWVPGHFAALGTDGFGPSDTTPALRHHFEVDARHICFHALGLLKEAGAIDPQLLVDYAEEYRKETVKINPATKTQST